MTIKGLLGRLEFHEDMQTYLLSFSEHGEDEDHYGRLSMWRAYSGQTNVALVMNAGRFLRPARALNAFTYPVLYKDVSGLKEDFSEPVWKGV